MKNSIIVIVAFLVGNFAIGQTVPSYVPTTGLIGWYPFNGNGLNAYGTAPNGKVLGPVLTTDRFGNANSAYHFNGLTDHILLDSAFFNIIWSNYTISWWMNNDTDDNIYSSNHDQCSLNTIPEDGIAVTYNWGLYRLYHVWANRDPAVHSTWSILAGRPSHDSVTSHVWNHFVFEKKNDSIYSFYINGKLDTVYKSNVIALNYYCRLNFGNIDSNTGHTEGVQGKLDDYAIWTRALDSCEIKRLHDTTAMTYITGHPSSVTSSVGSTVHLSVTAVGSGSTYQWQCNSGSGFVNLSNTGPYSGVTTPTLTITGITSSMNANKYRCFVSGLQPCTDTSAQSMLTVSPLGVNALGKTTITISPNPTTGIVNILGADDLLLRVYDCLGRVVKEAGKANEISIAGLPSGVYLVRCFDEAGLLVGVSKVVKQ